MPEVQPPILPPEMTELEKLNLKHKVINFANDHNMRYRDYGNYVALEIPHYNLERLVKGEKLDAKIRTTKDNRQGLKKSS